PLNAYFQARNCVIAFNTFVGSKGPAVELDAGMGGSGRTLRSERITIANNIFSVSGGPVFKGQEGNDFKWMANLVDTEKEGASPSDSEKRPGVKFVPTKMEHGKDGLWHPSGESPAREAAE